MCDLHMHMHRCDRAKVVLILFRSVRFQSYAVESQIREANKRDSNFRCCTQLRTQPTRVAASPRYPDLTACSSSNQDCKAISILAAAQHRTSDVFISFTTQVLGQTRHTASDTVPSIPASRLLVSESSGLPARLDIGTVAGGLRPRPHRGRPAKRPRPGARNDAARRRALPAGQNPAPVYAQ
jgi:hypothetical protein